MQGVSDEAVTALAGTHFDIPDEIRRLDCRIAPTSTGVVYYTGPSEDLVRPGAMWWSVPKGMTSFSTWQQRTTVYHEGVPGHHLQIGQTVLRAGQLNRYRRAGVWVSGHGEGWALYAEQLLADLGHLEDPGDRLGLIASQLLRAVRVVLDIGVHCGFEAPAAAGGGAWTYDTAWAYLSGNVPEPEATLRFELDRYLGHPGQAPSYKVGERSGSAARGGPCPRGGGLRPARVAPPRPRCRVGRARQPAPRPRMTAPPAPAPLLVLASRSPARLATLRSAGVRPHVRVSGVDEDEVVARYGVTDPADVALLLARAKAEDVATTLAGEGHGGALVVGCDSVLDLDGRALGKPGTAAVARQRWQEMRGPHGRAAHGPLARRRPGPRRRGTGASIGEVSSTLVRFADLDDDEIDAYVATGEPLEVAGSFTVDGLGGAFVEGIDGDHHAVVGIGLPTLRRLLRQVGVPWHGLWAAP